jgi:uracil-DNA glycosylase family 4
MIVSLDPDPTDETEGQPAGATVVKQLAEFMPGLSAAADKVYVTTLVKCVARTAGAARPPETEELDNCFPYFSKEFSITTPHYILTVGEQATRYILHKLFKDQPYREGDSLELRVFDNPAFRIVPVADPEELRARNADERKEYCARLGTLSHLMGI